MNQKLIFERQFSEKLYFYEKFILLNIFQLLKILVFVRMSACSFTLFVHLKES